MIRKMQTAALWKRTVVPNAFNEQIETWVQQSAPIEVVISYKSASVVRDNDVHTNRYTITGLTDDMRPSEGDKIVLGTKSYAIETIIETNRMRVMALMEDYGN